MYPNPVKDVLNFKADIAISEIRIYDMLGREVGVFMGGNNSIEKINIHTLSRGTYVLKILANGKIETHKFLKY